MWRSCGNRKRSSAQAQEQERAAAQAHEARREQQRQSERKSRLSFKERRELDELPARIEAAEAQKLALEARLADPTLYRGPGEQVAAVRAEHDRLESEIPAMYARWEELEGRA